MMYAIHTTGFGFAKVVHKAVARSSYNELAVAYCNELPPNWNTERLVHRALFYQATSTLRITRNGWFSRRDRLALVLQAFALLSK